MPGNWNLVDWGFFDLPYSNDTFLSRIGSRRKDWTDYTLTGLLTSTTKYIFTLSQHLTSAALVAMLSKLFSRFFTCSQTSSTTKPAITHQALPQRSFSVTRCEAWFNDICEIPDSTQMSTADILNICKDIDKEPHDIVWLILTYKMGVRRCGTITKEQWVKGMSYFDIDSSGKLKEYWGDIQRAFDHDPALEKDVYRFSFDYARDHEKDGGRIDIESAIFLVSLFLKDKWSLHNAFIRFLKDTHVKAMTKDQFTNILDFSRDLTSIDDYDDEGAWPVLLDEFVFYIKSGRRPSDLASVYDQPFQCPSSNFAL